MSNDKMSTTPIIETLLDRLNEWGERLTNQLKDLEARIQEHGKALGELRKGQDELRSGLDGLRKGQQELRDDLNAGLRRVERKIEILNDNILTVNADIRDPEILLEKLEGQSLTKT